MRERLKRVLTLRGRLLLLVLLAVAPVFGLIGVATWEERVQASADAERQTRQWAVLVAEEQGRLIEQARQLLALLASMPVMRDPAFLDRCNATLAQIRQQNPFYGNIGMADAGGTVRCSALPLKQVVNAADRSWFRRAVESRKAAIGDYLVGRISGLPSLTLGYPVLDEAGRVQSVLFAAIDLAWLQELASRLPLPPGAAILVIDTQGVVLARHPDSEREWMGRPAPESYLLGGIGAQECRGYAELHGLDGVLRLNAIEPLLRTNDGGCVYVRVGVPKAEIFAPIDHRFRRNLAAMVLVTLLAFAIAWFGSDYFVLRRMRALGHAAERLGQGDLGARTGLPHTPEEMGQLARRFDEMAAGIEDREGRILAADQALKRANRALSVLSAGNRTMLRATSEQGLLDDMCRMVVDKGGYRLAWVGYAAHDADGGIVRVAHAGADAEPVADLHLATGDDDRGHSVCATAAREQRAVVTRIADAPAAMTTWQEAARQHGLAACLALPLSVRDGVGGVLNIYAGEPDAFDAGEIELLNEAAADLAFGIARLRDQARRKEAEEANRIKSEFLANMSHELRTPLNAVIGFSEVLRDGLLGELSERQREYVNDIFTSGRHLLSLINDILDLSKVEAGKMTLDLETHEVGPLLENSLSIIKEKAAAHRISLLQELQPGLDPIRIDSRKTKQIIYNLLSNAVKFTPDGGRVLLRARRVDRQEVERWCSDLPNSMRLPLTANGFAHYLEISVEDTGIGIKPEDAPRLFQPFSQLDGSLARRFEGTGLGLVMVMSMAQLHGGTVAVASKPGEGSRFTVWLPWRKPETIPLQAGNAAPEPRHGGLALVVEDDDAAAELTRLQLEAEGLEVLRVGSAEAALELQASLHPQVIVLDVMLPGMDGWDFLARIKQRGSPWADVPVVICSIVPDARKGFSLGAAQVLQKPVGREDLTEALHRLGFRPHAERDVKILIVDDDPKAVELLAAYLGETGFRVLRGHGGREGIETARREKPDLLVLDLMMPEVTGFDVVDALKRSPETAATPIIVVTAKDIGPADRTLLNGWVSAILSKSDFNHASFMAEVRRALPKARREGQVEEVP